MKLTLSIPETLSEVTLDQYQRWLKVADGKELDNFLQQKMIEIFCGITLKQVLMLKAKDIEAIVADISKLFETKNSKFIDRFSYLYRSYTISVFGSSRVSICRLSQDSIANPKI